MSSNRRHMNRAAKRVLNRSGEARELMRHQMSGTNAHDAGELWNRVNRAERRLSRMMERAAKRGDV